MAPKQTAKVVVIVQARMRSVRLPNKSMRLLHGIPVVEWVYRRMKRLKFADQLIFAVPENSLDDALVNFLKKLGANVCRGSEFDVLSRLYNAALESNADQVVRICADSPFVSACEVDRLIDFFQTSEWSFPFWIQHV